MLSSSPWLSSRSGGGGVLLIPQKLGKETCTQFLNGSLAAWHHLQVRPDPATRGPSPSSRTSLTGEGCPKPCSCPLQKASRFSRGSKRGPGTSGERHRCLGGERARTDALRLKAAAALFASKTFCQTWNQPRAGVCGRMLLVLDHSIFIRKDAFGFL